MDVDMADQDAAGRLPEEAVSSGPSADTDQQMSDINAAPPGVPTPQSPTATVVSGITRSRYVPSGGLSRRRTRPNGSDGDIARPSSVPLPERTPAIPISGELRPSDLLGSQDTSEDRFPAGSAVNSFFLNLASIAATESAQIAGDETLMEDVEMRDVAQGTEGAASNALGIAEERMPLLGEASVPPPAPRSAPLASNSASDPPSNATSRTPWVLPSPAQTRSTNLLNSLHDLRTNLQSRVESLGQEVERLRRRAEALERGILQEGGEASAPVPIAEQGSAEQRTQAFRDANLRVRQLRLLRQQRSDAAAELRSSTPVWGPPGSTSPGTGGRRDPSVLDAAGSSATDPSGSRMERKRGSGVLEIEQGDRLWRRSRRMQQYKGKPDSMAEMTNGGEPIARSTTPPGPHPGESSEGQRQNLRTAFQSLYRTLESPGQPTFSLEWSTSPPRTTTALSATNARTYTPEQLERLRHPARTFGSVNSTPDRESLTSRGRRVTDRLERSGGDGDQRALPADATALADRWNARTQTVIDNTLTRYRDALLSNAADRLPPPAARPERPGSAASSTDSSIELIPELARLGVPAAPLPQPRATRINPAAGTTAYRSEIIAAEDATTSTDLAEDMPIGADPSQAGTGVTTGANLSRSVTLRFPHSRMANIPPWQPASATVARLRSGQDSTAQTAAPDSDPVAVTHDALHQLSVLSQTVTVLSERLDSARRLMRASMAPPSGRAATADGRPAQEQPARSGAATGSRIDSTGSSTRAQTANPVGRVPRRPGYPLSHTIHHPHHRPRIGPDPLATVINCDNYSSFEVTLTGNVVFRPAAARAPHRELIARCLSMLPGGRGAISRWMRTTGENGTRARRPASTAGYWVRWVSGPPSEVPERLRSMEWNRLPPVVAFQFAVCPQDDDPWVRADEIEFITPRTRLRSDQGPWMHSRVRIAAFENDPPIARFGTSAHIRQSAEAVGGLGHGDYLTVNLLDRTVEVYRADASARNGASNRAPGSASAGVRPSREAAAGGNNAVPPVMPAEPGPHNDDPDWLHRFEPALTQIRSIWRAHYRGQGLGPLPPDSNDVTDEDSAMSGSDTREGGRRAQRESALRPRQPQLRWSRDFLDADGDLLPVLDPTSMPVSPRAIEGPTGGSGVMQYL